MCLQSSPPERDPIPADWRPYYAMLREAQRLLTEAHALYPPGENAELVRVQDDLDCLIQAAAMAAYPGE